MIPVRPVDEPAGFDECVRQKGNAWLARNPAPKPPPSLWTDFLPHLREGFGHRCGYSAMYVSDGSVDHFRSQSAHRGLVYEWSNLRFSSSLMNSSKKARDVLDPYVVGPGWFEVMLPSMELVARYDRIPEEHHPLVKTTLATLPLVHDERVVRLRREWYAVYREGKLTLEGLRGFAPLIAEAIERWASERPDAPLP